MSPESLIHQSANRDYARATTSHDDPAVRIEIQTGRRSGRPATTRKNSLKAKPAALTEQKVEITVK